MIPRSAKSNSAKVSSDALIRSRSRKLCTNDAFSSSLWIRSTSYTLGTFPFSSVSFSSNSTFCVEYGFLNTTSLAFSSPNRARALSVFFLRFRNETMLPCGLSELSRRLVCALGLKSPFQGIVERLKASKRQKWWTCTIR